MSPKAEGPLGRLVRKRDDAVERLEAARAEREAITEVASGLPDLRDREARREQEEKRLTQRLLLSRYEVTRDRLERVHRKECESKDRPEKSQSFPGEQVSAIHRDRLRIDELEHELQQARSVAERDALGSSFARGVGGVRELPACGLSAGPPSVGLLAL